MGVEHGVYRRDKTWLEAKRAEEGRSGKERQPYCVVIGGGQGGIALGARLKQLDVPTIILEKNARAGRFLAQPLSFARAARSGLVRPSAVHPVPENWPIFTPKDKLGDWLEMYAKVMELNYWGSSECRPRRLRR